LGSGSSVQGIILGPGYRLFDACKIIAKQFLGLRTGDIHISEIDERHGDLCGHEGTGSSGGIFGDELLSIDIFVDLTRDPNAARVPLLRFWAGAAHIVQFGPIGVE
jgi:hypothetical protein